MLTAPRLDDLSWDDLRQLAQRRIPAASNGAWTHHAPVDPGITMLELLAFLLEQQVYVLDQVSDPLIRGILLLLGQAPRPTGVARTLLAPPLHAGPARLEAGTVVRPDSGDLDHLHFTVSETITILPVANVAVAIDGKEVAPDAATAPARLMPADRSPAEFEIIVQLDAPAPTDPGPLSLFVDLVAPSSVVPQWAANAADAPPPATLRFARVDGADAILLPGPALRDGTGGLRRPGLVTVAWQPEWNGASEIRLRVSTDRADFAEPPRLVRLIANVVRAEHRVTRVIDGRAPDGSSWDNARSAIAGQLDRWLPLSDQILDLPADLGAPLEGSVTLSLVQAGARTDWAETDELGFAGPADRLFTLDRERRRLVFGNGYTGRVPAPAQDFGLRLEAGGGTDGNLSAGLAWTIVDAPGPTPAIELSNVVPAEGGAPAEPSAEARQRVTGDLRQSGRVVTAADIRVLVETMPGLATHRAHVVVGYDPSFPCVHVPDSIGVFVVPRVCRDGEADRSAVPAPRADAGAMARFSQRLDESRLLATRIHVVHPVYHPAVLTVVARGSSDPLAEQAIRDALGGHLDAVVGGDEGDGWPFGRPLRPSELVRVAQTAAEDALLVERVSVAIDGATQADDCADTPIGPNDLVYLAACRIELLPPEGGGA